MLKFILQCENFFTFGKVSVDLTKLIKSLSLTILTDSFFSHKQSLWNKVLKSAAAAA